LFKFEITLKIPAINITAKVENSKNAISEASKPTQVPKRVKSRIVYQIQCPGCSANYVGSTIQHLSVRFIEHPNTTHQWDYTLSIASTTMG